MKKIINNKRCDTDIDIIFGDFLNGYASNEYSWAYEKKELYIRNTGEYFLVGRGGVLSKDGDIHENKGEIKEVIILLKSDEAKQ